MKIHVIKYHFTLLIALFFCFNLTALAQENQTTHDLLIRNVQVIDTNGELIKEPTNILVHDGRIVDISSKQYTALKVIEGNERFIIPGLIDSHVHLNSVPGYRPSGSDDSAMLARAYSQMPRSYLYFGFTTVLDLANNKRHISAWNQQPLRPTAYFCSPTPIANGYPLSWLPPEQQFESELAANLLYDERQASQMPETITPAEHSPKALVSRIKNEGARCIKAYYETGFGDKKDLPVPTKAMISALVKEAHIHDLPVFLHGNSLAAHRFAIDTGVDVLAHGLWHTSNNNTATLIRHLVDKNIAVQPTMQVIHGEAELFNPDYFAQKIVAHAIPADLIQWYQSEPGQWMKKQMEKRFVKADGSEISYQQVKDHYKDVFQNVNHATNMLSRHEGTLVFGSDTPSGPFYTQFPGLNGYREMQHLVNAGITLKQLLLSLTRDNARLLGLEQELGSVTIGLRADLLLLERNPLQDIGAYNDISYVILNGKTIERQSLSAMFTTTSHTKK